MPELAFRFSVDQTQYKAAKRRFESDTVRTWKKKIDLWTKENSIPFKEESKAKVDSGFY